MLSDFLSSAAASEELRAPACEAALAVRDNAVREYAQRFTSDVQGAQHPRRLEAIVESLAHMTVDRIVKDQNVEAEWMVYEMLARLSEAEQARARSERTSMAS